LEPPSDALELQGRTIAAASHREASPDAETIQVSLAKSPLHLNVVSRQNRGWELDLVVAGELTGAPLVPPRKSTRCRPIHRRTASVH
jgi:hypothetical protein